MNEELINQLYEKFGDADLIEGDDYEAIILAKSIDPSLQEDAILDVFYEFLSDNPI